MIIREERDLPGKAALSRGRSVFKKRKKERKKKKKEKRDRKNPAVITEDELSIPHPKFLGNEVTVVV